VTFDWLDWPDYLALSVIVGAAIYVVVDTVRDVTKRDDE
jgi:hypothetical protein